MAADTSYQPKTYRRTGGDESVIASGGKLIVESGGTIEIEAGGLLTGITATASVIAPDASDGAALGSTALMWSDLFLASGGVINFNDGDVTITHASNSLAIAGGTSYTVDAVVTPATNDAAALGTLSLMFSDLFLASGGVINFNAGNVTLTHSAGTLTLNNLLTLSGNTGLSFTGSGVTKGINFASATPAYADHDDAFIAIGTYNDAITINNTSAYSFIPIQVNLSSTGSCSSAGQQVAAMRLRVDTKTTAQQGTAIACAQFRSDLAVSCYAYCGLSQSANISQNITVEPGEFQVAFWQITGAGNIACTTGNVSVIEARMAGTGTGVDYVGLFSVNTAATIDSVIKVNVGAGTVTNGISIAGTMTTGVSIPATCTTGISIAAPIVSTSTLGITVATGAITATCATLNATSGRIASLKGTITAANLGDGYGAVEIDTTLAGALAGHTAGLSSWLSIGADFTGAIGASGIITPINVGIWCPSGRTLSSTKAVMGMRMECVVDDSADFQALYLFSTNIFGGAITAMFDATSTNELGMIASAATTTTTNHIPFFRDNNGTIYYVNVYTGG